MEEYEVELIDYLRVMWKGKWIILACLVLALVVSAAIMWTRPDEYALTIHYQYDEQLSDLITSSPSPLQILTSGAASQPAMQEASTLLHVIGTAAVPAAAARVTKRATAEDDSVQVVLSGSLSPAALSQLATDFTSLIRTRLIDHMRTQIETTTVSTGLRIAQLGKERDMLTDRMTAAIAANDPLADYLAQNVADLDGKIVRNQALVETLAVADPSSLFSLEISQGSPSLAGPNRRMSLAVAGVLGLFVGILLAFFIHYLVSVHAKEIERKRT